MVLFLNLIDVAALASYIVWLCNFPNWRIQKRCSRRRLFLQMSCEELVEDLLQERVHNHKDCKNRWSRHSSILESSTYVNMRHKALHRLRNGATFVPGKLIAKFVSAARSGGSRGCPGCPAVVKLLSKRWWIPIQARGLTGREQRWGSPTADQGFSSIQGTLVGFHCLWRLQHPSAPSMDKCKWQDDCEGLHFFYKTSCIQDLLL